MTKYVLFNKTDGILADEREFDTPAAATIAGEAFRRRFCIQGYYKAADGRRLKPDEIELEVFPNEK